MVEGWGWLGGRVVAVCGFWTPKTLLPSYSTYVQDTLISPIIPQKNYFTIQEVLRRAAFLEKTRSLSFTVHKIPAHLETTTMGYCSIPESIAVDRLAKLARDSVPEEGTLSTPSLETQRQQMHEASARLLISISDLLSSDGPSSDRLSSAATANQASSYEDPETHNALA